MGKENDVMLSYLEDNERFADAGEYLSKFTREDRIVPVYTLCVYHGEEPWDGRIRQN